MNVKPQYKSKLLKRNCAMCKEIFGSNECILENIKKILKGDI